MCCVADMIGYTLCTAQKLKKLKMNKCDGKHDPANGRLTHEKMLVIVCLGKNENICIPSGLDPSRGQEELSRLLGRTFCRVQADHLAITEAIAHRQTSTFILSGNPTSPVYLDFNVSAFMRKPWATWKRANLKSTHCKKLTKSGLIRNVFKSGSISRRFMTFSHEVCIHSPALLSLQNDKCSRASLKYLHHFNLFIFLTAIKFDHFTEQTCT